MPTTPLSPEKQAEVENLARVIHEAVDAEIGELAPNLAVTDDAHLFGDNEFRIRALAHKIAAKAIELHFAREGRKATLLIHEVRYAIWGGSTSLNCPDHVDI